MADRLLTGIDDAQVLKASITLPYTLTTGPAAGTYLKELSNHRLVGSLCEKCDRVMSPPQDYCPRCGTASNGFVLMPNTGTVTALTATDEGTLAFIQLDGADTNFLHRLSTDATGAAIGSRVRAVWSETLSNSMLDIDCFEIDDESAIGSVPTAFEPEEALTELPYSMSLHYEHSYGPHYGRLFDELATNRRILGSLCPSCSNVLVPPREYCDLCFVRTASHVDVADTGILQAFSIIHLEFVGQTRKPPYVYAEIVLDGAATRLIHTMSGFDVAEAKNILRVGMPVKAVWKDRADCVGTLDDIEYFEPILTRDP
jgi:uncharacterized OB-fold protein